MYQVIKRDGKVVDFNITRISNAITKAFEATQIPYSDDIINMLSLMVTADYASRIRGGRIEESGTHEELLALGGYYHDLYEHQFREERLKTAMKDIGIE